MRNRPAPEGADGFKGTGFESPYGVQGLTVTLRRANFFGEPVGSV